MSLKVAFGISMNPVSIPSDNFADKSPVPPRSALSAIFIRSLRLMPDARISKSSCCSTGKGPATLILVSSKFPSIFNSPDTIVQLSVESSSLTSSRIVSVSTILLSSSRLEMSVLLPLSSPRLERCPVLSTRFSGSSVNIDSSGISCMFVASHFPR